VVPNRSAAIVKLSHQALGTQQRADDPLLSSPWRGKLKLVHANNMCWLVVSTRLKNMKVSWDDYPNIWKN